MIVCVLFLQKSKCLIQKKEEGNTAFKAGEFQHAHRLYSEALSIDPLNKLTNAKLYNNRATVNTKVSCPSLPPPCLHNYTLPYYVIMWMWSFNVLKV